MELNCVANPDSNCEDCDLQGDFLCTFETSFSRKFLIGNIAYRVIALAVLFLAGVIVNQIWLMPSYLVGIILIFGVFEPRLLCSHCPHYQKSGRTLKCWALQGMPKLWEYRVGPITKIEKTTMLVLGVYVDLFPIVGIVWGIIGFWNNSAEYMLEGILLSVFSLGFLVIAYIFSKLLLGYACERCPNLSCAMNKTPHNIKTAFLNKNPIMKQAYEEAGWDTNLVSLEIKPE